jgi:hypothetical protein
MGRMIAGFPVTENTSDLGTKMAEGFSFAYRTPKSSLNQNTFIPLCYISVSSWNVLLSHCIIVASSASSYTIPPLHQITFFTTLRALKIHSATRRQPENSISRAPGAGGTSSCALCSDMDLMFQSHDFM